MLPISSNSVAESVPMLQNSHGGGGGARWWNKVFNLDMVEAKRQVLFALPMILTNVFYYCITLVSVMFAGHLGELELAGATLANSWATVTGFALMVGLSGALETLCGQGFGSKTYGLLGIYLQASCIISIIFSIFISIFWFFTQPVLILLHQEPAIAETAALYMKYLIPGLFAYAFLQNMLRFLQTQSVVIPTIVFSGVPLVFHVGVVYALVHWTSLGFRGAPLAASLSLCFSTIMLGVYVMFSKKFEETWEGFSVDSFCHVFSNLKLALPSAAMVCLEYWAFEILVILAGLMTNAETSTSLIAMCVNTEAIAYMLTYGLSAAASTRVSNELGANNPERAKNAMKMSLNLSVLLSLCFVLALGLGHNIWAGLFSDSSTIITEFASMTPLLVVSIVIDSMQGVLSGVARGCGWQNVAAFVNLGTFYFIGMPAAALLGFKFGLHTKGLWIGVICGLSCQAVCLLVVTLRSKWTKMELPAEENEENGH